MNPKALFVDDEPLILNALARTFRRQHLDVLVSEDPIEALRIVSEHEIDVIVSDFRMPSLVGTEFLRRARGLGCRAIRILVTGHADPDALRDALIDGTVDVLFRKPWRDELLRATVLQAALLRYAERARPEKAALG